MTSGPREQLALDFRWNQSADLARFERLGNEQVVAAIENLGTADGQSLYLSGPPGSGRSHLLQAACGEVSRRGATAVYLPLRDYCQADPALLEGFEHLTLVAIDDLDSVAGMTDWEEALFHCYNRLRDTGGHLLLAAGSAPSGLGLRLPDLVSRLDALLRFRLSPPDDARRAMILAHAAAERGLKLPSESARYLLRHEARDLHHLMQVLDRLDAASLQRQRRLTVPFIRSILDSDAAS